MGIDGNLPEPAQEPVIGLCEHALIEVLAERDGAEEYIDAILDEVLGPDRAEWSSAYGRVDALEEVRERIAQMLKPSIDKAWNRFEVALEQQAEPAQEQATGSWHDGLLEGQLRERERWLAQEQAEPFSSNAIGISAAAWKMGYEARKAEEQPEPVQEPVAWIQPDHLQKARVAPFLCRVEPTQRCADFVPLYTTPLQRPPLTDEEIDKATAQERDALLDHIYEYGTAAEGVLERIRKLCRAVERAHGIGDCEGAKS